LFIDLTTEGYCTENNLIVENTETKVSAMCCCLLLWQLCLNPLRTTMN